VNIAAVVAMQAAIDDREYLEGYRRQVDESKQVIYGACERLGLGYWKSSANFVLVHVGSHLQSVIEGLAARGIYVRDRSSEPGCSGCIRVGAGVVAHTRQLVAAMEEVLCAAR
jgi:histidinol-phosphate aminotransferase